MPAGLDSDEASFSGLQTAAFSPLWVLTWPFLHACMEGEREKAVVSSSSSKNTVLLDEHPTLMTLCNHNYLFKALSPNIVTMNVRASTYEFGGGHNSVHDTIPDQTKVLVPLVFPE